MEAHLRSRPDARVILCRLDEIAEGGSRGFEVQTPNGTRDIFIVRRGGAVFAYENSCPHTGTPLDWTPDRFLSDDKSHIVCATHGARFRIEDGLCFSGPCHGDRLARAAVEIDGGMIVLSEA